jgi:hypothetical protein
MYESRITAELKCEELAGLLATERTTAQMPAVTLEKLTLEMVPIVEMPPAEPTEPTPPVYARGGTALPVPRFPRVAVIAISAALTVITALGLATAI